MQCIKEALDDKSLIVVFDYFDARQIIYKM